MASFSRSSERSVASSARTTSVISWLARIMPPTAPAAVRQGASSALYQRSVPSSPATENRSARMASPASTLA